MDDTAAEIIKDTMNKTELLTLEYIIKWLKKYPAELVIEELEKRVKALKEQ